MKKALGSLTALLLLIVMLPAATEAAEGRIKYWYASRYTDEGYVWAEQSETWTDTGVTDNGETGRILDTPPDGAELWITNPPVPLTVEGNFSDVYLIGGTVTFLGDIEWLTLFEADWESPDITVYGDIEKITMSPLQQGEMSLRTTGDIGVVYLEYGEEGPFKSFSWYGDGVTMATLMDKGSILPPLSDGIDPEPPKGGARARQIGLIPPERVQAVEEKYAQVRREVQRLEGSGIPASEELNAMLERKGTAPVANSARLADLLRRPQVSYADIAPFDPERPELSPAVTDEVEIQIKYAGYLTRQEKQVEEFRKEEARLLPENLDYAAIPGLRLEAREKLAAIRPVSIGQAGRISGVSPADIAVLLIYLEQTNG